MSMLGVTDAVLWDAEALWLTEGSVFDKDAPYSAFWLLSDELLNQDRLSLASLTSDVCLPMNGKEILH